MAQKNYKSQNSISTIYSTLSATIQKGIITGNRDKITWFISELPSLKIQQTNPTDTRTIAKLNDIHALQTFKNGLNDK